MPCSPTMWTSGDYCSLCKIHFQHVHCACKLFFRDIPLIYCHKLQDVVWCLGLQEQTISVIFTHYLRNIACVFLTRVQHVQLTNSYRFIMYQMSNLILEKTFHLYMKDGCHFIIGSLSAPKLCIILTWLTHFPTSDQLSMVEEEWALCYKNNHISFVFKKHYPAFDDYGICSFKTYSRHTQFYKSLLKLIYFPILNE